MPARPQQIDNEAVAFERVNERLRKIEDAMRDRLLPPGYIVTQVGPHLVITRPDGMNATLVFA